LPSRRTNFQSFAGLLEFPALTIRRNSKGWNPTLKLIRKTPLTREPEVAEYPRAACLYIRFLATSKTLSRKGTIVLDYRFYDLGAV
jgi:hypothetical protein